MVQQITAVIRAVAALLICIECSKVMSKYPEIKTRIKKGIMAFELNKR
jgi:hypothetical protein